MWISMKETTLQYHLPICFRQTAKYISVGAREKKKREHYPITQHDKIQMLVKKQEIKSIERERACPFLESLQFCCLCHPTTRIYPSFGHLITESQNRDSVNVIHHQNPPVCIMVTLWSALIFFKESWMKRQKPHSWSVKQDKLKKAYWDNWKANIRISTWSPIVATPWEPEQDSSCCYHKENDGSFPLHWPPFWSQIHTQSWKNWKHTRSYSDLREQ